MLLLLSADSVGWPTRFSFSSYHQRDWAWKMPNRNQNIIRRATVCCLMTLVHMILIRHRLLLISVMNADSAANGSAHAIVYESSVHVWMICDQRHSPLLLTSSSYGLFAYDLVTVGRSIRSSLLQICKFRFCLCHTMSGMLIVHIAHKLQ